MHFELNRRRDRSTRASPEPVNSSKLAVVSRLPALSASPARLPNIPSNQPQSTQMDSNGTCKAREHSVGTRHQLLAVLTEEGCAVRRVPLRKRQPLACKTNIDKPRNRSLAIAAHQSRCQVGTFQAEGFAESLCPELARADRGDLLPRFLQFPLRQPMIVFLFFSLPFARSSL